jgi:DNA-binding NarL/FixJ family response regulator
VVEAGELLGRWAGWRVAEVDALRGRVGLPVAGSVEGVAGLTPREREVAALIARGKSNGEIAEALVLGKRTIETHVANIFTKLGIDSRREIAAWAANNGLTEDGASRAA